MMAHVDLCSGIGGFALGFEWAKLSKPVLFCDIEPWSRQILAKHWPDVPIAEDVKELANDPTRIIHAIGDRRSILSCGYPCQPFSQAGQRRGSEDDRHIWPEIFSIVQQVRPDWIVCENVSGHITMGLDEVLSDLADKANYAVQTFHLGAVSVDAPHRRMRLWIVARNVGNSNDEGIRPRIRRASSKSIEESSERKDHDEGSRANGRFADAGKPQNLQKDVANAISARGETWASDTVGDGDRSRSNKKQPKSSGSKADVADPQSVRTGKSRHAHKTEGSKESSATQPHGSSADVPNTDSRLGETQHQRSVLGKQNPEGSARGHSDEGLQRNRQWKPRSEICRVADGIPHWVDEPRDIPRVSQGVPNRVQRLKGLGNAILPQIAMRIGQTIKAVEDA